MTANEDLITWNTRWRLARGIESCRTCHSQQPETHRAEAFEHLSGCGHAGQHCTPWGDLDVIEIASDTEDDLHAG